MQSKITSELESAPIKLAIFDLDGTIVNRAGQITNRTRQAIAALQERGIRVALASGRPYFSARSIIGDLNIREPSLFFAGALIVDPVNGSTLRSKPLQFDEVRRLYQIGRVHSLAPELYSSSEFWVEEFGELPQIHVEHYLKQAPRIAPFDQLQNGDEILKVGFTVRAGSDQERIARNLSSQFPRLKFGVGYGAAHPDIVFVNATDPAASRESAFDWFLQHFNVTADQVAAFGDAEADLPFLTLARYGVAMGNANELVRSKARYITCSVEEDGVAVAIEMILGTAR